MSVDNAHFQVGLTNYSLKAGQYEIKKRVHLRPMRRNLGADKRSFELVNFVCVSARPTLGLAFLRRFQPCFNSSGYGFSCNYTSLKRASGEIA